MKTFGRIGLSILGIWFFIIGVWQCKEQRKQHKDQMIKQYIMVVPPRDSIQTSTVDKKIQQAKKMMERIHRENKALVEEREYKLNNNSVQATVSSHQFYQSFHTINGQQQWYQLTVQDGKIIGYVLESEELWSEKSNELTELWMLVRREGNKIWFEGPADNLQNVLYTVN